MELKTLCYGSYVNVTTHFVVDAQRGARQRPRRLRAARTAGGWGGVGELPHQGACSSQKEAETWGRGSPAALGEVGTQQPSAMRAGCRRGKIIPPPASRRTTPRQSLHCESVARSLLHVVVAAGATADEVGYTSPLHDPSTRDGDPPPPPTKQDVDGRSAAHSPRLLPRPPTHPPTRPPSPHHPYSWLDAKIASLFYLAPPPRPPRPVSRHSGFSRPDPGRRWMNPTAESSKSKGDRRRPRRRFSEEQIKSMESMFETQTKLEPRQKLQLARELGLQPRQVAIWFQNKRARWKSKQLEREYRALKADYDALLSSFDSLKKEKQLLLQQVTHRRLLVSPSSSFSVDRSPIPPHSCKTWQN
ncbi:hypothetical protein GW17_00055659 [Ensete ventricosum]|nr:hypothetical protein GW17_00055659 [Ensete ventricosum]